MINLGMMERVGARRPPTIELVIAWREFFAYKNKHYESTNQYHADIVLGAFKHLRRMAAEGETALALPDLHSAMKALRNIPQDEVDKHRELATLIYEDLMRLEPAQEATNLRHFVYVLASCGDPIMAREFWHAYLKRSASLDEKERLTGRVKMVWLKIFESFAKKGDEVELLRTFEMAQDWGVPYYSRIQETMMGFYASRDDKEGLKKWYAMPVTRADGRTNPRSTSLKILLSFCIRNGEVEWSKDIFRDILAGTPDKAAWDIVLQWAAGAMGKGVEDVERMMDVMVRRNPDDPFLRPDIATINGLVRLAISLKDPYLAERYIALGLKRGIQPNAETMILQLEYRAEAKDMTGAHAIYDALQSEEILENADLPAVNKYIRVLCLDSDLNYDRILSITSDLDQQKRRLEADTVSALCLMYLPRNEIPEMIDLLQVQSYNYTIKERARITDAFMSFILNRDNSTARAWDAYTVARQIFDEMSTEQRTKCMNEFFDRDRCDMACYVFGHMRQADLITRRPKLETYVQCFEGIARFEEPEYLHMVHNMLKMDGGIEPNTKLYNSLMLAYIACNDAHRALDFWDDITNSSEGPSYRSLDIVFRACGRKPFGDIKAREIWTKMRRMEIEVTGDVFASFIGALAGQGKFEEARDLIESMEQDLGLKPDFLT